MEDKPIYPKLTEEILKEAIKDIIKREEASFTCIINGKDYVLDMADWTREIEYREKLLKEANGKI